MQRYGQMIGLKRDAIDRYDALHTAVWPEVLDMIHACNIRNYSIFRLDATLFAYFEYVGVDFAGDMAKMANHPKTKEWWAHTQPLQAPREPRAAGEWWANMIEVFHTD